MDTNRILSIVSVAVAVIAVFVALEYWALILLVLGLVIGFLNPEKDSLQRMAYLVAAVGLPMVANNLDAIPTVGTQLHSIIDNIAAVIAGVAIANFVMAVWDRLVPSASE